MIDIKYTDKNEYRKLTMRGHAGYDEKGKDIVCSAATILAFTLAARLDDLRDQCEELTIRLVEGDIVIESRSPFAGVMDAYDTVMCGIHLLWQQYPANVYVTREG